MNIHHERFGMNVEYSHVKLRSRTPFQAIILIVTTTRRIQTPCELYFHFPVLQQRRIKYMRFEHFHSDSWKYFVCVFVCELFNCVHFRLVTGYSCRYISGLHCQWQRQVVVENNCIRFSCGKKRWHRMNRMNVNTWPDIHTSSVWR